MQPINEVVQIEHALTRGEVASLRAELEHRGFRATAGAYPAGYRDNDRLVFDDAELAGRLFALLSRHLPREVLTVDGERAELVGLNPRFRACRYRAGQSFQRHRDGAYAPDESVRSERTLMLYLTDGDTHQGGRTRFYESADPQAPARLTITPRAGLATVFPHDVWHDGEAVTGGTKVVLRSDLLYRRAVLPPMRSSGHRGYVWDVCTDRGGGWLSVGRDGTLRASREGAGGMRETAAIPLQLGSPTALARGASEQIVVGSRHGRMATVRRIDGAYVESRERRVHRGAVLRLAPCGTGFVSAGADGVLQVLDAECGPIARHTLRTGGFLWGLASQASHAERGARGPRAWGDTRPHSWLVGGEGGRIHHLVFDGERIHETARHPVRAAVRSLAAHATDGVWVGLGDGRVVSVDGTGSVQAHRGPVTALAMLGNGHLVSGGEDGRVLLLDLRALRTGTPLHPTVLAKRRDFITCLLPTSKHHVLVAGYDGQLVLVSVGALAALAHADARVESGHGHIGQ